MLSNCVIDVDFAATNCLILIKWNSLLGMELIIVRLNVFLEFIPIEEHGSEYLFTAHKLEELNLT